MVQNTVINFCSDMWSSCKEGVCTLSQKDTVATTDKVDDVRRVVSNDAFCIQVSALKWILECQQGNGDSGRFGRTPGKLWVTEGVKIKKSVLQDRNKHKHLQMTPHWEGLSGFRFPRWEAPQRHSGVWKNKKEQCSLASGATEWHFHDVSQILPWDW